MVMQIAACPLPIANGREFKVATFPVTVREPAIALM